MRVVEERDHTTGESIWHIPAGPPDQAVTFQPIACGGGITFPGSPTNVLAAQVCPDCRARS